MSRERWEIRFRGRKRGRGQDTKVSSDCSSNQPMVVYKPVLFLPPPRKGAQQFCGLSIRDATCLQV